MAKIFTPLLLPWLAVVILLMLVIVALAIVAGMMEVASEVEIVATYHMIYGYFGWGIFLCKTYQGRVWESMIWRLLISPDIFYHHSWPFSVSSSASWLCPYHMMCCTVPRSPMRSNHSWQESRTLRKNMAVLKKGWPCQRDDILHWSPLLMSMFCQRNIDHMGELTTQVGYIIG